MEISTFIEKLKIKNAKGYWVGGYVRDKVDSEVHNKPFTYKDRDYSVAGLTIAEFEELFPEAKRIGTKADIYENGEVREDKTPVYLLEVDGEISEVALARSEIKIGDNFAFFYDKKTTILDDLKRRDYTMNAMAIDLETNELIDPFNGKLDIENKEIKGIFLEAENEVELKENEIKLINKEFYFKNGGKILSSKLPQDELRGIRAGRFAAKMGYVIEVTTLRALQQLEGEIKKLHPSRIYEEVKKALVGERPDLFLQTMKDAKLLNDFLPEIDELDKFDQSPNKHPEGDVFVHTKQVSLAAAILTRELKQNDKISLEKNVISSFFHDVGKKLTQTYNVEKDVYQYIGHEKEGIPLVLIFLNRWNVTSWRDHMEKVTGKHMSMHNDFKKIKANKIAGLFSDSIKKKQFTGEEIEQAKAYFITKDKLKEVDDLDLFVKGIIEKQKGMGHLLKNVGLTFRKEINEKRVTKKDWKKAKENGRQIEYIKSKIMSEGSLKKYYRYEKEKGIESDMEVEDFYIACASDALGRLKNTDNQVEIFKEAASIIKINDIRNQKIIKEKLVQWKETYGLEDGYVEDFNLFLQNHAISKEYNLKKQEVTSTINEDTLREVGKKPDDIAFAKFENKRNQEIKMVKVMQRSFEKGSEVDLSIKNIFY